MVTLTTSRSNLDPASASYSFHYINSFLHALYVCFKSRFYRAAVMETTNKTMIGCEVLKGKNRFRCVKPL